MTAALKDASGASSPWTASAVAYGCFVMTAIALLHPTAWAMAKTWATSSTYVHGFLVAPAAFWMISTNSRLQRPGGSALPGIVIILIACALWLAGRAANVLIVEEAALITLLIGGVGVIFGARSLGDWFYPLLFLYFMVPFGETLIPYLQYVTAQTVTSLLSLFGAQVAVDGYLIRTGAGTFEIAEACAGLRFLIAAVMIAAIFAYLQFQSWRKRFLFLAFAVAVAVFANGLRAFLLVLIATLTEKRWAVGPDHVLVGWLFYGLVFFVLISVGARFADKKNIFSPVPAQPGRLRTAARFLAALIIVALAAGYDIAVVERPVARTAPASLSLLNAPGWRILPPPENWRASLPHADRTLAATYSMPDKTVYISVGYFTHDRRRAEIVTYGNRAWDGDYWRKIGDAREVVYLFGESKKTGVAILAGPERRRLAAVAAYWLDGEIYIDPWRMKIAQMKAKLRGANPVGGVVIIAASYQHEPDEAVRAIRAFTTDVEPLQGWLARNGAL